jgi:hypothetical protein
MNKKQLKDIQTGIWLIGLAILFLTDNWWPGILVLIGVSMVISSLLRRDQAPQAPLGTETIDPQPNDLPNPSPPVTPPEEPIQPAQAPIPQKAQQPFPPFSQPREPLRPVDRLPETCDACGAPVRATDVHWTGFDTARCAFCGSDLIMKK